MHDYLTPDERLAILEVEVEQVDTYNGDLYLLLVDLHTLLKVISENVVPAFKSESAERRLDSLIAIVKRKINMRYNYRMVMQQLNFVKD